MNEDDQSRTQDGAGKRDEVLPNGRTRPIYWFKIAGETESGEPVEGWVHQKNLFIKSRTESDTARVVSGEGAKEWTLDYVERMINDYRFREALQTTLLLIVLILPIQFVLAITMALFASLTVLPQLLVVTKPYEIGRASCRERV